MPFWSRTWPRPAACTSETISASTSSLELVTGFNKTSPTSSTHSYGLSLRREKAGKTTGTYKGVLLPLSSPEEGTREMPVKQTNVMINAIILLNLIHLRYRNKSNFSEAEKEQKHILIRGVA